MRNYKYEEAIKILQTCLSIADYTSSGFKLEKEFYIKIFTKIGLAYEEIGFIIKAVENYENALRLCTEYKDYDLEGSVEAFQGIANNHYKIDFSKVIDYMLNFDIKNIGHSNMINFSIGLRKD